MKERYYSGTNCGLLTYLIVKHGHADRLARALTRRAVEILDADAIARYSSLSLFPSFFLFFFLIPFLCGLLFFVVLYFLLIFSLLVLRYFCYFFLIE